MAVSYPSDIGDVILGYSPVESGEAQLAGALGPPFAPAQLLGYLQASAVPGAVSLSALAEASPLGGVPAGTARVVVLAEAPGAVTWDGAGGLVVANATTLDVWFYAD